jgi:hypothetical protein
MTFRTAHFDGMARVPSYTDWVIDCDMTPAYEYHRRTLRLLQWHCPPRLWHLKTPVHLLALDALVAAYPGARFIWTHRDPAEVLGSVCSLIAYTRSWVSDRQDPAELGIEQLAVWSEAVRRGTAFRDQHPDRFADVQFFDLNADPVGAVGRAYKQIGLELGDDASERMRAWAEANPRGAHGTHEYTLDEWGLQPAQVREAFGHAARI